MAGRESDRKTGRLKKARTGKFDDYDENGMRDGIRLFSIF